MHFQHQMASKFFPPRWEFHTRYSGWDTLYYPGLQKWSASSVISGGASCCSIWTYILFAYTLSWLDTSQLWSEVTKLFKSVHGACVSYLGGVYWFRLDTALGRPSGPRCESSSRPASSKRGKDERVRVCMSPCERTLVNVSDLFKKKKKNTQASLALMKLKK